MDKTNPSYGRVRFDLGHRAILLAQVSIAPDYYGTVGGAELRAGIGDPLYGKPSTYPLASATGQSQCFNYDGSTPILASPGSYLAQFTLIFRYHNLHEMNERPTEITDWSRLRSTTLDTPVILGFHWLMSGV